MKKNTVKKIFIFFLFFLPLQYAMVGIVGLKASEPWPAFVFPGFKSVNDNSEVIIIEKPVFIAETETGERGIDTKILFSGIKESQRLGFLDTNFSDSFKTTQLSAESRRWLKKLINKKYPHLEGLQALRILWKKEFYGNRGAEVVLDSTIIEKDISIRF